MPSRFLPLASLLAVLVAPAATLRAAEPDAASLEFFEKKIRPLLQSHCRECHSAATKRRGGLTLDSRSTLLKGGDTGPAVTPGDPEKSLLIKAIRFEDQLRMPKRGRLTDEQIADLTAWVRMGAPWPDDGGTTTAAKPFDLAERRKHWSYQPLRVVEPPAVKDTGWPRSPVDRFLLARLEAAGLRPAAAADKRTLLRRVTFDLTGLPPTPQEVADFLADDRPDAYERVVDRLLASTAYGERWGRHWLDLVRFAETAGHEFDFDMPDAYLYRDYVIRALNADVPYDQFLREQIAGDLLPQPRRHPTERYNESVLGTGFWLLGESKHSPVDVRADGSDRRDNMIDVFGKTFLAQTVGCARCHDHKFDAIETRDYYALSGYLQSSRQQRAFLDDPDRIGKPLAELRATRAEARRLAVARTALSLEDRLAALPSALRNVEGTPEAWRTAHAKRSTWGADHPFSFWGILNDPAVKTPEQFAAKRRELVERLKKEAARAEEDAKRVTVFADFRNGYRDWFVSGDAFGDRPSTVDDVVIDPQAAPPVRRLAGLGTAHSGLTSGRLQGALRSRTFVLDRKFILLRVLGKGVRVNLIVDGFQQIRAPIYGDLTFQINHGDAPRWHAVNVSMWQGQRAYVELLDDGDGAGGFDRILFADEARPPADGPNAFWLRFLDDESLKDADALAGKYGSALRELVKQWRDGRLPAQPDAVDRVAVLNALLASNLIEALPESKPAEDAVRQQLVALTETARRQEAALPAPRRGMALADGSGVDERVHIRGNHKNLGEAALRRLPLAAGGDGMAAAPADGSGRLQLAERLTDPANPLVPRVIVNRLWLHHFGEGIVRTPDDFGAQGQPPTHPELLDWLAAEFMRTGWSLKKTHRLLVTSSAYRMQSRGDEAAERADPQNKLLHRMPVRRLEAEAIRDAMLAVSGRLDRTLYGPGVMPYLTPFMVGRGRPGSSGPLDGDGRRSVYLAVRRNFLNPMFLAFDYPVPFSTMGRRTSSNVPAQALSLLNNPFVVQQAQLWSKRVLAEPDRTPAQRVTGMYVTAFGREATKEELADALQFLEEQGREYGKADDPRAWADLAHVLFNVKEFIFVP